MLPTPGFHHLHLNSVDPDRAIDFYTRQFPSTAKGEWGGYPALKSPNDVLVLFANFRCGRSDRRGKNPCRCPTQSARSADDAVWRFRVLERRGGQNGYQPRSDTKEMQKVSRPYPTKIENSRYSAVNSGKGTSRDREGFSGRASVVFRG